MGLILRRASPSAFQVVGESSHWHDEATASAVSPGRTPSGVCHVGEERRVSSSNVCLQNHSGEAQEPAACETTRLWPCPPVDRGRASR